MAKQAPQVSYVVGEHIRLKARSANEHLSYQIVSDQTAYLREPVDGLVLSIREVSSGRLVAQTKGNPDGYVFELLFDNTFNPRFASVRNAARSVERPTAAPGWKRMRATLREMAEKGELISTNAPAFLAEGVLAKGLDGWKVIKVRSQEIESLESVTDTEQDSPAK